MSKASNAQRRKDRRRIKDISDLRGLLAGQMLTRARLQNALRFCTTVLAMEHKHEQEAQTKAGQEGSMLHLP